AGVAAGKAAQHAGVLHRHLHAVLPGGLAPEAGQILLCIDQRTIHVKQDCSYHTIVFPSIKSIPLSLFFRAMSNSLAAKKRIYTPGNVYPLHFFLSESLFRVPWTGTPGASAPSGP